MSKPPTVLDEMNSLLEFYGTFTRPDASGDRMGFTGRRKLPLKRLGDFPYDDPVWYGQPHAYDRGSGGRETGYATVVLPHDVSHSAWDDVEEAMGMPFSIGKAVQGAQMGHATGVPGADGGWANSPIKPWDEEDEDERLAGFGESYQNMTINPSIPPIEPVPNAPTPYFHDTTDDELEKKLDRIWGRDDNTNFVDRKADRDRKNAADKKKRQEQEPSAALVPSAIYIVPSATPFMTGLGRSMRGSRGLGGMIPKESIWIRLDRLTQKKG